MLLTAVAATVVIVAWLTNRPGPPSAPVAQPPPDTQLSEQPLVGLGGGVTVRELTQDTPFSLVAMTGDVAGTSARVRAKRPDGSWGPWYQTEYETAAPDSADPTAPAEAPRGTDPVFVGNTTTVQIVVTRPMNAPVTRGPGGPSAERRRFGIPARDHGTAIRAEHLRDPYLAAAGAGRKAMDAAGRSRHARPGAGHHQPRGLGRR